MYSIKEGLVEEEHDHTQHENIDKHHVLDDEIFSYRVNKDGKVFISWYGKQVMILKGQAAQNFVKKIADLDPFQVQLVMAKLTGNFKRGNERRK